MNQYGTNMKQSTSLQFDLEQQIMHCWNVCEDLQILYTFILDSSECEKVPAAVVDKISNALLGMETMYNMKFDRLFNTFERYLHAKRNEKISGDAGKNHSAEEEYFNDPFNSLYTD